MYCQNVILSGKETWRDDGRCGINFAASTGLVAECVPDDGKSHCCNTVTGRCGKTDIHCKCQYCIDYSLGILILF